MAPLQQKRNAYKIAKHQFVGLCGFVAGATFLCRGIVKIERLCYTDRRDIGGQEL